MKSSLVGRPIALALAATLFATSSLTAYAQPAQSSQRRDPGYVLLSDFTRPCTDQAHPENCDVPRSARPSTISEDTPVMSREEFIRRYPNVGAEGYDRIVSSNLSLCDEAHQYMAGLNDLDQIFKISDNEYGALQDIYNSLPSNVRRTTVIMQIGQAVQTGALCLLSASLYCIAAVAGGVGNIFSAENSKDLQLANIKLSIANIVVTRANIASNRITLRLDGIWLKHFVPACARLGYETLSGLPPMPVMPAIPESFGKEP